MKELLVIKREIERVIVIGDNHNFEKAKKQFENEGYRIVASGAKPITLGQYSNKQFKMVAEKRID